MNNMIHVTYTGMSTEKEAALGLHQLVVKFLTDDNSWNVNGSTILRTVGGRRSNSWYWASWFLPTFLHSPTYVFSVGFLRAKFQVTNLKFSRLWQQWRTQKIIMEGVPFSGIWWSFVFGVRCL